MFVIQATRKSRVALAYMYFSNRGKQFSSEMYCAGSRVHGIVVSSSSMKVGKHL
jgi:hypothetical protein